VPHAFPFSPGIYFVISILRFELARFPERYPIVGQITRAIAFTWTSACSISAATRNTEHLKTKAPQSGMIEWWCAGMIEVKMSIDDDGNFVRRYPVSCAGSHPAVAHVRWHRARFVSRPFSAIPSLNQYLFGARIDEYTIHIHPNTVLLVGWTQLRQKLRGTTPNIALHRDGIRLSGIISTR